MAGLPENWEWDYDGKRWFYRFKPTGLIQFTFPKPGDEFPEFVDDTSEPPDLPPEEKLVSQQQIKRRSTLGESQSKQTSTTARRDRAPSNAVSDIDDGGAPFWLQPDGLMYMGPGAYNDISPLQEEEEERGLENGGGEVPDASTPSTVATSMVATAPTAATTATTVTAATTATTTTADTTATTVTAATTTTADTTATTATAATVTNVVTANESPVPPTGSQVSPVTSVKTTPLVVDSLPAMATPELDSGVVVEANEHAPVDAAQEPPEIPLLDSRQIPYNPIGFMAELPSEFTAQCDDEINPAPVEMPSNEIMVDTSEPAPYANAFHFAPVELPLNEARVGRNPPGNVAEEKSITTQVPLREEQEQQRKAHQAVRELLNRPYKPVRQNSLPQSVSALDQPSNTAATGPNPGKYQAYNPAKHAVLGVAAASRSSTVEPRDRQPPPVDDNKRHTMAGPPAPRFRMSEVTPALPPAHAHPVDSAGSGAQATVPNSRPRPESISGPITQANSGGLAHFPSVLQPARGRPVLRNQTPPQSQGASPARTYQAYKPYRDLQRDIEDTVQLLSQSGYGQGTTAATPEASDPMRPRISRTSTLPAHLPALPFMGVRPHLPHSVTSEPTTLRDLQSGQAPSSGESIGIPSGREAGTALAQPYHASLPPSGADVPQPLNLSRKSPPPQNGRPTFTSMVEPSSTAKPGVVPGDTTLAPSGTIIASAPIVSSTVEDKTGDYAKQSGVMVQPDLLPVADQPRQGSPERTKATTSSDSGQPITSGFSVMVESTMSPTPQGLTSVLPAAMNSESSTNQPLPATPSPQEAVNAPSQVVHAQNSSIVSDSAHVPGSGTLSRTLPADPQTGETARQSGLPQSERVGQGTSQNSFQSDLVASGPQNSANIIPRHEQTTQVAHQSPPQPTSTLSTDPAVQTQGAYVPATSTTPPTSSFNEPRNPAHGQAMAPLPPSVTPKPPSPRTPSPVSRASSPPTRTGVTEGFQPFTPPVPIMNNLTQNSGVAAQNPPGQGGFQAPIVGSGATATTFSSAPPNGMPATSSAAPVYALPSGHHPLASHPVNVPQPSPVRAEPSASTRTAPVISSQSAPMAHNNAGTPGSGSTLNQQQSGAVPTTMPSQPPTQNSPSQGPPVPVSPSSHGQQTAVSSATSTPSQKASQPTVPQVLPVPGNGQLPAQSGGQMPPMQLSQPPAAAPPGLHQAPHNMPLRTFSHSMVPQPGPPSRPPVPGTAPPHMSVMFPPPAMAPGMQPQGFQPGMPPQHYYGFQPGTLVQPGMQQQQQRQQQYFMAPHMMQPSQMPGGPYVMQPQAPQPVKEEKGWFGRLWRGDTVKKANPMTPANRLQKGAPHQGPLASPPQLHPNQPQQQQFAHPGAPHMMMMPGHLAQQSHLQQAPNMQQQQQQHQQQQQQHQQQQQQPQQAQQPQQQQQPLMWKPNGSGAQNPQFPPVKQNKPNQSTLPPPEVLQSIKQQEQRLPQGQAAQKGTGSGNGKASTAPALAASSGYDGSGWGDDDDDDGEFK